MIYLLDTNIVLAYLRQHPLCEFIDQQYAALAPENYPVVSVVTWAELESLARQNNWGFRRINEIQQFLSRFLLADINRREIVLRYAEIDAFSQGKLHGQPLQGSARNMGKNDIWIAATASVLGATLLTTDKDFDHLHDNYLPVVRLDPHR
ncbi:PIN domain-containing protein [Nibrella viscosa]|uniref:PIN domain-containing protein n=1 Tax=Nibrella viscosa TaxID=1084524 RepID=A0ABP8K8Q2_9BACT